MNNTLKNNINSKKIYTEAQLFEILFEKLVNQNKKLFDEQNKKISSLETQIKKLLSTIEDCSKLKPKKTISTLTYAINKFNSAPSLTMLEDDSLNKLFVSAAGASIENTIISENVNNNLCVYLGDIIINEYKKNDPKRQSIWCTDASRMSFIIRKNISGVNEWHKDKKGLNFINLIIDPIAKKAQEYDKSIDVKSLSHNILKYVTAYFIFDKIL